MEHRSRPARGPFEVGQLVFLWRKNRFDNRAHWHGPAVIIGKAGSSKIWVAKGTKVYRCCPEQLKCLSPDQEATVKLLPADMVHIRGQVSAKGAGNYHDLSMLERPPDEEAGAPSEAVPDDSLEPNMGAAGVGEAPLDEGDEGPHVELPMETEESQELRSPRQAPETTAGDESPAKRARKPAEVTPLTRMLRGDPELLDRGCASGSSEPLGVERAHEGRE